MYMLSVYAHMYVCSYSIFSIYELLFCSWIYAKENEGVIDDDEGSRVGREVERCRGEKKMLSGTRVVEGSREGRGVERGTNRDQYSVYISRT